MLPKTNVVANKTTIRESRTFLIFQAFFILKMIYQFNFVK